LRLRPRLLAAGYWAAISRENVELALGMLDAWNRGDRDGWLAPAHAETEWSSAVLRAVEGTDTVYRGRTELEHFWDEWHAVWNLELELTDARDLGEPVLLLAHMRTRGKASGAEVERSIGYVIEFEDGMLRRVRAYLSPGEALEAVGLSE
jgi:ketosteroid isomerase-like protein